MLLRQPAVKKVATVHHFFYKVDGHVKIMIRRFKPDSRVANLNSVQTFRHVNFVAKNALKFCEERRGDFWSLRLI